MTATSGYSYTFPFGVHRGKHVNEVDRGYTGWWFCNNIHPSARECLSRNDWLCILNAKEYYTIGRRNSRSSIRDEIQDGFLPEPF